jgi:magnesium transporter
MSYEILKGGRITWTNIVNPTPEDMARLGEAYPHFHPLDLEDCLSQIERPKIDEYDNYLFIVIHFPLWDPEHRISRPGEVDLFVGSGFLVTVHGGQLMPLVNLFEQCKDDAEAREQYMGTGAGALMHTVIDRLVDYIFPILYKVDANIRHLEDDIFIGNSRQVIQDISFARRDIIALRRIIRPQIAILANLEAVDRPYIREELDVYFGDVLDHMQRARDVIDDSAEVIVGLADTADTLASHRINEVMRILTVISVIMLPLSLISGILGMNVPYPFQNNPATFFGILGFMLILSLAMLAFFRYRRWL